MKFGLYLQKKGIITAGQLVDALDFQHGRLSPIGQLAIEEGLLSARDVFRVLRCQTDFPNERFGEMAVSIGLMTRDQLQHLLMLQADRKPSLVDVLVRQGALTAEQADGQLSEYRRDIERRNVVIKRRIPTTPHLPKLPRIPASGSADAEFSGMRI